MPEPQVDYDALAKQHGANTPAVDYEALAKQSGATSSASAPSMFDGLISPSDHPGIISRVLNAPTDYLGGLRSGIMSTGVGAYNLARKIPGAADVLPAPSDDIQKLTQAPDSLAGKTGKFLEQAAEFALPMGEVNSAVKAAEAARVAKAAVTGVKAATVLPTIARIGAETATAGGTAAVQSGGDPAATAMAAATTGGLGTAGALIPAGAKAAAMKMLSSAVRPLSQGAIDLAEKYGVPLSQGALGGSKTVQGVEKILGSTVASDLYETQAAQAQAGMNAGAKDLSGGFATDKFSAGDNTIKTMLDQAKDHATTSQSEYANLAALEADPANARSVQVGTKPQTASTLLDGNGRPIAGAPATVPVMQDMGLPVDMRDAKQTLAPLEQEISRRMTPAQLRADPGLAAIRNILTRPDFLPASVAEGDLSYLKEIMRSGATGQAKRLAGAAIDSLDLGVKDAVSQAGPGAVDSLNNARAAWKSRSDILDTVKGLANDESGQTGQVMLTNKLIQPSDASFPALQKVLAVAPNAADDLGKAYLTERVFKGAANGADFTNPTEARNLWNQIGPRTKAALYTPETIGNINSFLDLAKRMNENPNPSNSGMVNAMVKMGALVLHPVQGAMAIGFGRPLAKILYNPAGAAALKTMMEAPGSIEAGKAMTVVRSMLDEAGTSAQKP